MCADDFLSGSPARPSAQKPTSQALEEPVAYNDSNIAEEILQEESQPAADDVEVAVESQNDLDVLMQEDEEAAVYRPSFL